MNSNSTTRVYLDASVVVAYLIENHIFSEAARELFRKNLLSANFYLSLLTLDEILFTLNRTYSFSKSEIHLGLKETIFISDSIQVVNYSPGMSSANEYLRIWKNNNLKPRDALHLFLMQENNIKTIGTFDADFKKVKGINVIGL